MALLWIDSFDHYDDPAQKYTLTGETSNVDITASPSRTGGGALQSYRSGSVEHNLLYDAASVICGIAFRQPSTAVTTRGIFAFYIDGSRVGAVTINAASRTVEIRNTNGTLVESSSTGIFEFDTWHYIETKCVPGNIGVGSIEVKLDGSVVATEAAADFQPSGTTAIDTVRIGGFATQNDNTYYDDLYILDETGSDNNDYLGDCIVRHFHPSADGSLSSGWSRLSGSSDTSAVNEASADGDTSYLYASATGAEVHLDFEDYSGAQTIYGVAVTSIGRQEVSGSSRQIIGMCKSSGTTSAAASARTLANTYQGIQGVWDNDPDTGTAWTASGFNSAQLGPRLDV